MNNSKIDDQGKDQQDQIADKDDTDTLIEERETNLNTPQIIDQNQKEGDEQQAQLQIQEIDYRDICNVILLIVCYLYQGLVQTFFGVTIPLLIVSEASKVSGMSGEEKLKQLSGKLALLSMMATPYSFKFVLSPILDTYYFSKFGKRKTYIVPALYLLAILVFISSYQIEQLMINVQTVEIFIWGILIFFIFTIQDIAVDGWTVTLLQEKNIAYASFAQTTGHIIGGFISFNIYIWLSSEEVCKEYLNLDHAVLNPQKLFMFMVISLILGAFYLSFFKQEVTVDSQSQGKLVETLIKLKYFYQNKNILIFILFMFSIPLGFSLIATTSSLLTVKGFSRITIANVDFILTPIQLLAAFYAAKFSSQKKELSYFMWFSVLLVGNGIFAYFVIITYDGNDNKIIIQYIAMNIIGTIVGTVMSIFLSAFYLRMSDLQYSGIYITFMNSFRNLGGIISSTLSMFLLGFLDVSSLVIIGVIYWLISFIAWISKLKYFEESDKKTWLLCDQVNNNEVPSDAIPDVNNDKDNKPNKIVENLEQKNCKDNESEQQESSNKPGDQAIQKGVNQLQ